jgi:hypothetical protein
MNNSTRPSVFLNLFSNSLRLFTELWETQFSIIDIFKKLAETLDAQGVLLGQIVEENFIWKITPLIFFRIEEGKTKKINLDQDILISKGPIYEPSDEKIPRSLAEQKIAKYLVLNPINLDSSLINEDEKEDINLIRCCLLLGWNKNFEFEEEPNLLFTSYLTYWLLEAVKISFDRLLFFKREIKIWEKARMGNSQVQLQEATRQSLNFPKNNFTYCSISDYADATLGLIINPSRD